jgi:hypothetical protein
MKLEKSHLKYNRKKISEVKDAIYVFTDNCDRTSGKLDIPDDSSYSKRFGRTGLKYPTVTSAVIRGLENAFPVTTCKCYSQKKSERIFHDVDFENFKKLVDADFEAIKNACIERGIDRIIFPTGGVLNGTYSDITRTRTPLLYWYVVKKEIELRDFELPKKENKL